MTGWPVGGPWPAHPELRSFEPPTGDSYVHLQQIDGPPRVHLDVEPPSHDETVTAAVAAGASVVHQATSWTALVSPGGLPFCVLKVTSGAPPPAVTMPGGHRVRLVQVCIDSPRPAHEAEMSFWRSLLGGRWVPSPAPEFAGKWHDAGSPLQLLFQELAEDGGPVRAHLDLGTDDLVAEVARLTALGAADVGAGHGGWHVLRDPAGLPFCVTGNSPEQTEHRDFG